MFKKVLLLLFILSFSILGEITIINYNSCLHIHHKDVNTTAYTNYCWNCDATISSNTCTKCNDCGWYICKNCGECYWDCSRTQSKGFLSGLSTGELFLCLIGVVGGGYILIKLIDMARSKK